MEPKLCAVDDIDIGIDNIDIDIDTDIRFRYLISNIG